MVVIAIVTCAAGSVHAQTHVKKWTVSTNALSWLNLGTINLEGGMSLNEHLSLNAGITANPWEIDTPTLVRLQNKQYGTHVGVKYWPWHTFSEWWIGAKVQYKFFDQVGLLTAAQTKGHALGAGISAGYSFMITENFNLDFGLGVWGGRLLGFEYGNELSPRNFIFIDNIMVSLVYIF